MIEEADRDGDGEICEDEFMRIMRKTNLFWAERKQDGAFLRAVILVWNLNDNKTEITDAVKKRFHQFLYNLN